MVLRQRPRKSFAEIAEDVMPFLEARVPPFIFERGSKPRVLQAIGDMGMTEKLQVRASEMIRVARWSEGEARSASPVPAYVQPIDAGTRSCSSFGFGTVTSTVHRQSDDSRLLTRAEGRDRIWSSQQ